MDRQQQNVEHRWKGFAMQALPQNTLTLPVFCPELLPGATQGVFKPGNTTNSISTTDISGATSSRTVTTSNHVVAEWKSLSNDDYPPTVAKGEQVWLYQQANSDKFYWDSAGRDKEKRTLERRRMAISATPTSGETKTDANTYFNEWNSVDGYVTLAKTSQQNGEPKSIYIGINTKTGRVLISDNSGSSDGTTPNNFFVMDMVNNVFQWTNADKSTLRIDKQSAMLDVQKDFIVKAGRQILLDSPLITLNRAKTGAVIINGASMAINLTGDFVLTAAKAGINAITKITGALLTAAIRAVSMVTGAMTGTYQPVTADLTNGTVTTPTNAADNDTSGGSDHHGTSWESVDAAFQATAQAISQVATAAKTSVDTSGITSNSADAKQTNIKGT